MASPHVAGVGALVISLGVTSPAAVRDVLQSTAEDHGTLGWDSTYGWGIVDAYAALASLSTANQTPVAEANGPYSGTTGIAVSFSGTGSYDADGDIVSWNWVFGDGTSASGESVMHAYSTFGTYTVTLTVTDNDGATDTDTATVTVTDPVVSGVMHVASIGMAKSTWTVRKSTYYSATALVTVVNANGEPVDKVTVSGHWSGLTSDTETSLTIASGQVSLVSNSTKKPGAFTFTIDNLVKSGWTYDQAANAKTSDFITVP
jgi:serine protease